MNNEINEMQQCMKCITCISRGKIKEKMNKERSHTHIERLRVLLKYVNAARPGKIP